MTENANAAAAPHEPAHSFRRKMTGKVVKDKMHKTVVVECVDDQVGTLQEWVFQDPGENLRQSLPCIYIMLPLLQ